MSSALGEGPTETEPIFLGDEKSPLADAKSRESTD